MSDSIIVACAECSAPNRIPNEKLAKQPRCGRCQSPVLSSKPIALNQLNFEAQVQRSQLPAIIDFWAPWCGPCLQFAPTFEKAGATLIPRIRLLKLDTQAFPTLAQSFGIRSIPTLVAVHEGRELGRLSGALPLNDFLHWAEQWA